MFIRKFDPALLIREYGENGMRVAPPEGFPEPPFGAMWATVDPGDVSSPNNHHEAEAFFVLDGEAEVEVDDERHRVGTGDVVYVEPFEAHALRNTSSDEELRFLSVWWEDDALLEQSEQLREAERRTSEPE